MLITAVGTPGSGQTHAFRVRHGMNPHVELWRHGLVVREYLSADRVDDEIVVTAHVAPRTSSSQPPRTRKSVPDLSEDRQADEPVRPYQRIAAYALYGHGGDYWVPSARHAPQSLACGRYLEVV